MASKAVRKRAKVRNKKRIKNERQGVPSPHVFDIKIDTVDDSIITFSNILKAYHAGRMKREKFTGLVYGLNCYCNFLRLKVEADIETRLDQIERRINEQPVGFRE